MKIAVITMHAVKNYGSALQTYATQKVLTDLGYDVEIIHYIRKKNLDSNLADTWTARDRGVARAIKRLVLRPTLKRWRVVFNGYLKKYIHTSKRVYSGEQELLADPVQADVFCTGSDQVWNSGWSQGIEKAFYLTFVPDEVPKVALAASIGTSELSEEECARVFPYLRRYQAISIRETSSAAFLKEKGFDNVSFCLDPTQLLTRDQWLDHALPRKGLPEQYILLYQLNHNPEFDAFALAFAKRKGLPLYRLCTRYDQARLPGKPIFLPQVQEWVSILNNAQIVLTDSFHASAFCINLNTQFVAVFPQEYSCRIADLLRLYGLEDRRLTGYDQLDIADRPIDFDRTNEILYRERSRCLELIREMMEKAAGNASGNVLGNTSGNAAENAAGK